MRFVFMFLLTVAACQAGDAKWYKGNLHTHTLNSDGDSTPADVAAWYRENRYQFLVLTDHNYFTETAGLNATYGAAGRFLLIPGEEVSDVADRKPIHLNAYAPESLVEPAHGAGVADTVARNLKAIRAKKGLPALNHPNFDWAISADDLRGIEDIPLLEIYNGHPFVHNRGGGGVQSTEEIWDALLTAGKRVYGTAVDDAHEFKLFGKARSNPGRGWVVVRAPSLTETGILQSLESGDFYASTGVELKDIRISEDEYRIEIKPLLSTRFTTVFIGDKGEVLARSFENAPVYRFRGNEAYVRARVECSNGDNAWTQPVFRKRP